MTDAHKSVHELFVQVRDIPSEDRTAWLAANCPDATVRHEVLDLLRYDIDDPFMEKPILAAADPNATFTYRFPPACTHSLFAGRYKLLQIIGEGGFGVVYMADQIEPVRRRVAIKLLKANIESKSVVVRFETERQALAMMDHPNIASVFDGGVSDDGTPYFVMELVNGVPINDFCDANQLHHTDRMQLFMNVCNAVQHAHQKGIIHRDLKPSNILVSLCDGKPVPKVIDFGIAKAIHGPLTDKTLFTAFQQMVGTPEYMSPEQAETSILDIDTRSDIYSLGVVAYELLTGTTPFDGRALRKLGFAEIQRTIREIDPPKPSDRLGTLNQQRSQVVVKHGMPHGKMQRAIRGDLDWIVMKAMEKDRNRRYGSAQSMADDLRRWMCEEPIEARPPSFRYRTIKMIRRHSTRFAIAAILVFGTLIAATGLGYGLSERNASKQRQRDALERNSQLQSIAENEAGRNRTLRYGNAMFAAHESFRSGRRSTTLELLAECPEDKRGVEWKWLNNLASDRTRLLMQGSPKNAQSAVVFASSKRRLYSAGVDGMLRLWNPDTYQELQSWRVSDEQIIAIQIDQHDSMLAIITKSGQIILWDTVHGRAMDFIDGHNTANIVCLQVSNDSKSHQVAVGLEDGSILLWQDNFQAQPIRLENKSQPFRGAIQTLQFCHGGLRLLAAGKGGITSFDSKTGSVIQTVGQNWQSYRAMIATDLARVVMFGPPVATCDLESLANPRTIQVTSSEITAGAYVEKDKSLIFATEDQSLRRVHLETGHQETLGYYHHGRIVRLVATPDGDSIALLDASGSLRILSRPSFACPDTFQAFDCEVSSIAAKDSNAVYCLSDCGELVAWDANRNVEQMRQDAHQLQGFSLALNSNGSQLVSNGLDQQMAIWSTQTNELLNRQLLALGARFIALHPDGRHLAGPMPKNLEAVAMPGFDFSEANGSNLAFWNLETGMVEKCFSKLSNWAMKLRFSDDGKMLAAATVSDGAVVWLIDRMEPLRFIAEGNPQVDEVAFSKDGKHLLAGYHHGRLNIWNIETQQLERQIVCHGDQFSGLLMTNDGSRIMTASASDSTLRVWDWRTGQKCAEFDIELSGITDLVFADDEGSLLIGGKDGRIHRWKLR